MAGYDVYIGDILLPIAPESINMKINGKNKVYNLINEGEMNILKLAGLTTVSFSILLPAIYYPFAVYRNGFKQPSYFLNEFERLKQSKKPFQFIVGRNDSNTVRKNLHNTNMTVSLEDYSISEDAKSQGFDVKVDITLKQYKEFKTKTFTVVTPSPTAPIAIAPVRPTSTTSEPQKPGSGSGGSGSGTKKYKVQIPGMGVVEVTATSIQDAITKAGAGSWTGTIYVDGVAYYVNKGKLALEPAKVKAAIDAVLPNTLSEIGKQAAKDALKTVVTPAMITGVQKASATETLQTKTNQTINNILNKNVLGTTSTSATVVKPTTNSSGKAVTGAITKIATKNMLVKN